MNWQEGPGAGTCATARQDDFEAAEAEREQAQGWERALDLLKALNRSELSGHPRQFAR
jgi:hypothetical protein